MLLDAGRSILRDEGLGTGAEAITFKRVFDRVERERVSGSPMRRSSSGCGRTRLSSKPIFW